MVFEGEDQKVTISEFKGTYSRLGNPDEVPMDHAQDSLNISFPVAGGFESRNGMSKVLQVPLVGIKKFTLIEQSPNNLNQPLTYASNAPDGGGLLIMDNNGNVYVGNNPTPIYHSGAVNDFCSVNIGNKTYISPFNNFGGVQGGRLQVYNAITNTSRDAAGLAPAQPYPAGPSMLAANSGASGNVSAGVHKFLVLYETDTGFWTPPGPKRQIPCTPAASVTVNDPTIFTSAYQHGMATGESHAIRNFPNVGQSLWANCNDVYFVTVIDDTHFSIPVNTFGYTSPPTGQIDAGIIPAVCTCDGTKLVHLTNIPIGPPFVKRRIIIGTRANEQEYFFIPLTAADGTTTPVTPGSEGVIPDNLTTAVFVNFFDTDLTVSADYLFDLLEVIPGGGALCKYRGRLVIAGIFSLDGIRDRVILSNIGDQESFNWVNGYIQVQTESDGNSPAGLFVLRDTLYITKFTGTTAYEDNGQNPSTWQPSVIDSVIGAYGNGINNWTVSQPTSSDTGDIVILASKVGLILFDGVMRRPELSYKIQGIWSRINFASMYRVQVAHDPWLRLLYVLVPLDNSLVPNALLVADYTDGRDPVNLRWTVYSFPQGTPSCIGMGFFGSWASLASGTYDLKFAFSNSSYMFRMNPKVTTDDGNAINSYYTTAMVKLGGVCTFKMLNFRGRWSSQLNMTLSDIDDIMVVPLRALPAASNPGREFQRQCNFVNEGVDVKIQCSGPMNIMKLDVWGISTWPVRPQ